MNVPQHITERLEDYLDGTLDQAAHDELQAWLAESDDHCRAVADWFLNEVEMLEAARLANMQMVFGRMTYDARAVNGELSTLATKPPVSRARRWGWMAIAASIALAVATANLLWGSRGADSPQPIVVSSQATPAAAKPADEPLLPAPAILARTADCVWGPEMKPLRVGQDIAAGVLISIKSGLAQLIFESGAEVVLKGPCQMRVDNSMLCMLSAGNVSAEVPPRAAGFTIRGPSAEVIDLGTRFGFSVGAEGTSEVHVFQGEVISRQLNERGEVFGKEIRLKKNQAVLFPGEKKEAQRLAANEAKFALEVRPLWRQDKIEPLVVDREIALWLSASHGVQLDRKSKVIAWQDLALGENHISNDAFQPDAPSRPRYVLDAIGGRPAIRFDGMASYLTTTPMTTTDNQTIVVAFKHAPPPAKGERVAGQIINYNGPPSRYLPDVHSPGVLQLGEKVDVWNGPATSIAAKAFVGHDSRGADVSAGITVSKTLGHNRPRVVSYVYNNAENVATLYVDGRPVAGASAPTSVAVTSRKVIGKHGIFDQWYFRGDLGEVVIYNAALSPREVQAVSQQLLEQYGVASQDTAL